MHAVLLMPSHRQLHHHTLGIIVHSPLHPVPAIKDHMWLLWAACRCITGVQPPAVKAAGQEPGNPHQMAGASSGSSCCLLALPAC